MKRIKPTMMNMIMMKSMMGSEGVRE
jgi:hypothetical protein